VVDAAGSVDFTSEAVSDASTVEVSAWENETTRVGATGDVERLMGTLISKGALSIATLPTELVVLQAS
jgi:hypothetical protein